MHNIMTSAAENRIHPPIIVAINIISFAPLRPQKRVNVEKGKKPGLYDDEPRCRYTACYDERRWTWLSPFVGSVKEPSIKLDYIMHGVNDDVTITYVPPFQ